MLQCTVATILASEQLIGCGDWNGHIGSKSTGFEEVHGGQAIGKRDTEGERISEFAFANELVVDNTWFKKKPNRLVTYQTGVAATQTSSCTGGVSGNRCSMLRSSLGRSVHHNIGCWLEISKFPSLPNPSLCHVSWCGSLETHKSKQNSLKAKAQDSELSQTSTMDERWTSLKDKTLTGYKAGVRCFLKSPMD